MAKTRRVSKRERRSAAPEHPRSSRAPAAASSGALRRGVLWGLPVIVTVVGLLLYLAWNSPRAAGITFFAGSIAWLIFALSDIGARLKPQDRTRAGAIDFGTRR